jgi:hypothetical protein
MINAAVLLLLFSFSTGAVYGFIPQDDALVGTWDVTLTEMGMEMQLIFKKDGDAYTGEMVFDMGGAELENITFEKGTLTFSATVDAGGQTVALDATADIKGDEISGTMSTDMGELDFEGTKRKDD